MLRCPSSCRECGPKPWAWVTSTTSWECRWAVEQNCGPAWVETILQVRCRVQANVWEGTRGKVAAVAGSQLMRSLCLAKCAVVSPVVVLLASSACLDAVLCSFSHLAASTQENRGQLLHVWIEIVLKVVCIFPHQFLVPRVHLRTTTYGHHYNARLSRHAGPRVQPMGA